MFEINNHTLKRLTCKTRIYFILLLHFRKPPFDLDGIVPRNATSGGMYCLRN